ncbi:phospholipase A2-alpha [Quercus suber]|uniref:phospholipase A2-alpha n=1 Tax=Quercus suber TaxID=58331 RepID=UPI000CE193A4|nr:phospholipase A2-alpha [Quercus suber]
MAPHHSLKFASLLLSCSFIALNLHYIPVYALNVGLQYSDALVSLDTGCSNTCESEFCKVAPFLRYGKYCGLLYSGCPGERPCDGLDTCCMKHDDCVGNTTSGYLSQECSQNMINCMADVKKSGSPSFAGNQCDVNETIEVITVVMQAALAAGGFIHDP